MEVTVRNSLGFACECAVVINIGKISVKSLSANCECVGSKYMESACFKLSLDFVKLCLSAFCCNGVVELKKLYRACSDSACPVISEAFAIGNSVDSELVVGCPVDS